MSTTSNHEHGSAEVKAESVDMDAKTTASCGAGQARSRITVVCAECKRLKLKCDRRIPCSSCQKRDCVNRCVYTQAAAEKIDVQSLHNRVLVLEAALAQLKAHPSYGTTLAASVFPPQFLQPAGTGSAATAYNGLAHNDRALLATGQDGSSLSIPLDDVASIWMSDLDIDGDGLLPPGSRDITAPNGGLTLTPNSGPELNKLDPSTHWPPLTPYYLDMPPPNGVTTSADQLHVTPALCQLLPRSPAIRSYLLDCLERTLRVHPSVHWPHLKMRIEAMLAWSDAHTHGAHPPPHTAPPSVSFFAVTAAGLALGAFVASTEHGSTISGTKEAEPAALLALSTHAMSVFELGSGYDVDSVVAMLFQVLFMLHDREGVGMKNTVFPLVGKMINVARQMGLHTDPDEHPGLYTLFEAEMRRRVWWEVFYYDVFVSDSMGHVPLIADNSHTTRIPVALEDDRLTPTSTTMPYASEHSTTVSAYLVQKIKLARLVKHVKKDIFTDPIEPSAELTIEQATVIEGDIQQWMSELPSCFRFDLDPTSLELAPISADAASSLLAQRCELFLIANRLILKLYHAFLRQPRGSAGPPHQALLGTVNAAHAIIGAAQVLHTQMAVSRPAAFLFYSFARGVFDATVICAHAVIASPNAIWARTAHEDTEAGLALLRATSSARPCAVEGEAWEGVSVVERMLARAAKARGIDSTSSGPRAGNKRKRANSVTEAQASTFRLPFLGADVSVDMSSNGDAPPPAPIRRPPPAINTSLSGPSSQPPSAVPRPSTKNKPTVKHSSSDKSESGKPSKKVAYPTVGYRVRESKKVSPPEPSREDYQALAPPSMLDLSLRRRSIDQQASSAGLTYTPASATVSGGMSGFASSEVPTSGSMDYYLPVDSFPTSYALPVSKNSSYHASDGEQASGSSPFTATSQQQYAVDAAYSTQPSPASYAPQYYMSYPPASADASGSVYGAGPTPTADRQKGPELYGGSGDLFLPGVQSEAAAPGTLQHWQTTSRGVTPSLDYWGPTPTYNMPPQPPQGHQWA